MNLKVMFPLSIYNYFVKAYLYIYIIFTIIIDCIKAQILPGSQHLEGRRGSYLLVVTRLVSGALCMVVCPILFIICQVYTFIDSCVSIFYQKYVYFIYFC